MPIILWGRSRTLNLRLDEITQRLDYLISGLIRMEKAMAQGQQNLSREIRELSDKVDAYTSERGAEITKAVQAAREAWEKQSDEEFEEAAQEIDRIAQRLQSENPGQFEPSQQG
jgi:hypothetical protein